MKTDILVIDSLLRRSSEMSLIQHNTAEEPNSALRDGLVLWPTSSAVKAMAREFGYQAALLRPGRTPNGVAKFPNRGSRRIFICAKRTPLADMQRAMSKRHRPTRS